MTIGELKERLSRYDDNEKLVAYSGGKFTEANYVVLNVSDTDNNFVGLTIENSTM